MWNLLNLVISNLTLKLYRTSSPIRQTLQMILCSYFVHLWFQAFWTHLLQVSVRTQTYFRLSLLSVSAERIRSDSRKYVCVHRVPSSGIKEVRFDQAWLKGAGMGIDRRTGMLGCEITSRDGIHAGVWAYVTFRSHAGVWDNVTYIRIAFKLWCEITLRLAVTLGCEITLRIAVMLGCEITLHKSVD